MIISTSRIAPDVRSPKTRGLSLRKRVLTVGGKERQHCREDHTIAIRGCSWKTPRSHDEPSQMYFRDCHRDTVLWSSCHYVTTGIAWRLRTQNREKLLLGSGATERTRTAESKLNSRATEPAVFEEAMTNEKFGRKSVFLAAVLIVALGAASAQTTSPLSTQSITIAGSPTNIRPGHVLVRFKATAGQDVLNQLNTAFGAKLVGTIREIGVMHLQAPPERTLRLVAHLRNRPDVEFAEFDSVAQAILQPNDPYYSSALSSSHSGSVDQWGPPAVSAPTAWNSTLGDRNIVIAIVDTGVDDTHPDLAPKIVGEYSYVGKGKTKDGFGHGTHVAGIAAAATNNHIGIAGMCPNCGILSVKVLNDQGSGYMSDVASGIAYAASQGARVINLSLGGANRTETLHAALDYALAHNALPVCAMGNNGASFALEPAYWHDCLSVIATDQNGARASFSNYGVKADVAAPGVAILSTMPTYPVTLNSYGYYENYDALSGTSMATPMVSGIAGLVLSKNPNLTALQLRGILEASAGDGTSWTPALAFGIVDASKAVAAAVNSANVAPSLNWISPVEGTSVAGLITFQAAPSTSVHHIDFVKDGSRFLQVLTGRSGSTWSESWSSTSVFNGPLTLSVSAVDVFGNTVPQDLDLSVQNNLVTQTGTANLCWPSTTSCPHTIWQPVTTGVATAAATHLHGTVTYGTLTNTNYQDFWLQVGTVTKSAGVSNVVLYFCGMPTTTVDCYPDPGFILLQPGKNSANYSGGQIDLISPNKNPSSGSATINWTLTYPQ